MDIMAWQPPTSKVTVLLFTPRPLGIKVLVYLGRRPCPRVRPRPSEARYPGQPERAAGTRRRRRLGDIEAVTAMVDRDRRTRLCYLAQARESEAPPVQLRLSVRTQLT